MNTSDKVTDYIQGIGDWRGDLLAELRGLIQETAPELTEDFKWSVPVWTNNGLVCAISAFKDHIKINFFKGVYLADPKGLFNSGLDSKEHRSINFVEDAVLDKSSLQALIKAAVAFNQK
jgi:hypothetical protein